MKTSGVLKAERARKNERYTFFSGLRQAQEERCRLLSRRTRLVRLGSGVAVRKLLGLMLNRKSRR